MRVMWSEEGSNRRTQVNEDSLIRDSMRRKSNMLRELMHGCYMEIIRAGGVSTVILLLSVVLCPL